MKSWIGMLLIIGALLALFNHVNAWACVAIAVLGGVLIDANDVTGALKVVAPYIPGKIGQRLSGNFPPPPPPPPPADDGPHHP